MFRLISAGKNEGTLRWLTHLKSRSLFDGLNSEARKGVKALAGATPRDTGKTAAAWDYTISQTATSLTITWTNDNEVAGTPLVLLLTYGHGTGTGGYVSGRDFINPAIQPVMDEIANNVWKKVTSG